MQHQYHWPDQPIAAFAAPIISLPCQSSSSSSHCTHQTIVTNTHSAPNL
jgi:hypothetical protein